MATDRLFIFGLFLALAAGCGREPVRLAPVHGTIYDQQGTLKSGTVVFTPDPNRGGRGPLACAEIQRDGSYALSTGQKPGAVAGWHRVTILVPEPTERAAPTLPHKYCDPEQSGLACEVKADRENSFDFHLQ
jgi:hypothetical protein